MAKTISFDDNHIRFLDDRSDVLRCPLCEVATHPYEHGFPNEKTPDGLDISNCFEGFVLLSQRLKTYLEDNCTSPLEFFETGGGYFVLRPTSVVFEDFGATRIEHSDLCEACGRHNSAYGIPSGLMAGQREIGPMDLVRSAQERGHAGQKTFRLIVGDSLAERLVSEGFVGLFVVEYNDELVAEAVLNKAAALHKSREFVRSANLYQDFIDAFSYGLDKEQDREYLLAYAAFHQHHVGRKIGRKQYSEVSIDHLEALYQSASGIWRAKFPLPENN